MASYYKTVRVLVQPRLYKAPIDARYLNICIEACRGVCETYKELHYKLPVAFTSLSLQSVFLAGMPLPSAKIGPHCHMTDKHPRFDAHLLHVARYEHESQLQKHWRVE